MEKKVQSPLKRFVVEKGGNPRGKGVTKDDIKQALRDINEWFKAHAKTYYATLSARKGAGEDEIKKIQTALGTTPLPLTVQALLSTHNGGFQMLDTYLTLSASDTVAALSTLKTKAKWKPTLVPIARNVDQEYLCVDATGGKDSGVVEWTAEGMEVVSESLGTYLETIRDSLLLKKLEYDDGLGLVFVVDSKK